MNDIDKKLINFTIIEAPNVFKDDQAGRPATGMLARWMMMKKIDQNILSDEQFCRVACDFYNDTLSRHDTPRHFAKMGWVGE